MTILDTILADTRALVAARKQRVPIVELREQAAKAAPPVAFASALRRPGGLAVIAECKKASPSEGTLRADYDAAAIARRYEAAGAAAISVLTEPAHFGGSLADLDAVRAAVAVPVLRKDFVVDAYQLAEARAHGADAVLLIAAALDPVRLHDLHDEATALGLGVLVELHDDTELDGLDLDRLAVVGVNSRDLRTFAVDPHRAGRLFARLPARIVRVAESGLRTPADLARVHAAGADAVLVGTALMRAADPGAALAGLLGVSAPFSA